jgi:hypothetical protein
VLGVLLCLLAQFVLIDDTKLVQFLSMDDAELVILKSTFCPGSLFNVGSVLVTVHSARCFFS